MEDYLTYVYKDEEYIVKITRKNIKNMYFKIKNDSLEVTAGPFFSNKQIKVFVHDNIEKFIKFINKRINNQTINYKSNFLYIFGIKKMFFVEQNKNPSYYETDDMLYIKTLTGAKSEVTKEIKKYLKEKLNNYIKVKLPELEKTMNLDKHNYSIVYKESNWGTNMVNKNKISFSSKLAHFSHEVIECVIVHELAHSIEPNHSKAFWAIVKKYVPDYKEYKSILNNK